MLCRIMLSETNCKLYIILLLLRKVYNLLYISFSSLSQYLITGRLDNSYYNLVLNLLKNRAYLCSFEYWLKNTIHKRKVEQICQLHWNFIFKKKENCIRYTIWTRSLIRVKRRYDVTYFFFTSRFQKYCAPSFFCRIVWKMFMWIFCCFW